MIDGATTEAPPSVVWAALHAEFRHETGWWMPYWETRLRRDVQPGNVGTEHDVQVHPPGRHHQVLLSPRFVARVTDSIEPHHLMVKFPEGDFGLIERVNVRRKRRDYFAPRRGASANTIRLWLDRLVAVEDLITEALEQFRHREHVVPCLEEVHEVYHWYRRELTKLHERFCAQYQGAQAGSAQKER